jgi:hypothetical protein
LVGITRERLESFDRPITCEPQWFDGKKDDLIRDFKHYLGILKSVHSGADLQAASAAAGDRWVPLLLQLLQLLLVIGGCLCCFSFCSCSAGL